MTPRHKPAHAAILSLALLAAASLAAAQVPPASPGAATQPAVRLRAFPQAQGYGAYARGGRGGRVIAVTNLNDSGPGSLRAACEAKGPRIVVFRTGGIIHLKKFLRIKEPYLTLAAQTAPGDGICIRGWPVAVQTHDVIIRGLRVRAGDDQDGLLGSNSDALEIANKEGGVYNVILDHCSFSWAIDENLSTWYPCRDITIQWCIISEALYKSRHEKGPHSMGLLIGDDTHRVTVHHNLMAHNNYRNPQLKGRTSSEIANNVIYNWGWSGIPLSDPEGAGPMRSHILGNLFIPGADSKPEAGCVHLGANIADESCIWMQGNLADPQWKLVTPRSDRTRRQMADKPLFEPSDLRVEPVESIREPVLTDAGAVWPQRDAVDARVVQQVRSRTGRIIDSPQQVGGWPVYHAGQTPPDSDNDGMPDEWEKKHGLDPARADDAADDDGDGYTNIEEYLNGTGPRTPQLAQPPAVPAVPATSRPGSPHAQTGAIPHQSPLH